MSVQDGMLVFFYHYNYRHSHPLWETSVYILDWRLKKYSLINVLSPLPRNKEEVGRVFASHLEKPKKLDLYTTGGQKSAESRLCLFVQLLMVQISQCASGPFVLLKEGCFPKTLRKKNGVQLRLISIQT